MDQALNLTIQLLKHFEGCRLKAYQDCVGIWTIGYGETLNVTPGLTWTQEYADERLRIRAEQFMMHVLKSCPQLRLSSPNKLAACTSLAYNIGVGAFSVSSVCRLTKRGDYKMAGDKFLVWNKAGGKVNKGLSYRRGKEREIYLQA
ncbi:MAG TPA: lysozyme [Methanosarcina sp.]|nr:lysozyme [Methanosarcina sp.]